MTGLEIAAASLAGAGAVASAVGTFQSIAMQNRAATANAEAAGSAAVQAREQGELAADRVRTAGAKLQGTLRANAAASGINPDMGSPLEVAAENAANIELDALTARYAGAIRARDFEIEAIGQRLQRRNPWIGAATSALASAGAAASGYLGRAGAGAPQGLDGGGSWIPWRGLGPRLDSAGRIVGGV